MTNLIQMRDDRRLRLVVLATIFAVSLTVYLTTLAPTVTWRHSGADGGDLIAAVATMGVPHPTGYPTYVLLGRIFLLIPWGDLAHRLNVMSAVFAALTVCLLCLILDRALRQLSDEGKAYAETPLAAGGAGLSLAFSPLFWSQAVIAEVYALHAFLVALVTYLLLHYVQRPQRRHLMFAACTFGVALGNHLTAALLAPALPFLIRSRTRRAQLLEDLPWALLALVLGLSIYVYLPIGASRLPPVNWGAAHTWQGFRWVVSGSPYRRFVFTLPAEYIPDRIVAWLGLLSDQFGWWGTLLGITGWWSLWHRRRHLTICSSIPFVAYSVYAIGYNTSDSHVYLVPAYMLFALWLGFGLDYLLAELRTLLGPSRAKVLPAMAVCLALLTPVSSLVNNVHTVDVSDDYTARDYGLDALATLPPQAIVISHSDAHTFTLWYLVYAERQRQDVAVIDGDLLQYAWYRAHIRHLYPQIAPQKGQWSAVVPVTSLIEANLDRRAVYLTDPPDWVKSRYGVSPEGPVYRLVS